MEVDLASASVTDISLSYRLIQVKRHEIARQLQNVQIMQIARQLQKVQIMQIAGADNEYESFPKSNDRF